MDSQEVKGYLSKEETATIVKSYYANLEENKLGHEATVEWAKLIKEYQERVMPVELAYIYTDEEKTRRALSMIEATSPVLESRKITDNFEEYRLLSSDLLALQFLLTNNRLDRIINNEDPSDEKRVALAIKYLDRVRKLHNESELLASGKYETTLGMEWELKSERFGEMPGATLEENNAFERMQTNLGFISTVAPLSFGTIDRPETDTKGAFEMVTIPTQGHELTLQEMLYLLKAGDFKKFDTMHITIAGVELSPEHTEVMTLQIIAIATGLYSKSKGTEGGGIFYEPFKKYLSRDEKLYYFPGFMPRKLDKYFPLPYGSKKHQTGVEFRSSWAPKIGDDWFDKFSKSVEILHLGAEAIRAVQKNDSERLPRDIALAECWNSLITDWGALLTEYGIDQPENVAGGMYAEFSDFPDANNFGPFTKYDYLISDVYDKGWRSDGFTEKSTELVNKFTDGVKKAIG